jgi:hypothetical protein
MVDTEGDNRGSGAGYWHRREKAWAQKDIRFNGKALKAEVFIRLVELQGHKCGLCDMSDAFGGLQADHFHNPKLAGGGELRGALCYHCNGRIVGCVEKWGHYRNEVVTALADAYLATPPAMLFHDELMQVKPYLPPKQTERKR